ncbi:MAG: peptide chain release factor 1 [Candidatus Diapherotrites archaeon]|nr:peptide chain release factor 1 [Candidatus Diapherotrites archaeon]
MAHSKENWEFRKQLKFLATLRGQGTELISIYIPSDYNVNEVTNKLREEAGQAMNIKSKQTRKNVTGAIERLLHALTGYRKVPDKGIAFFAGNLSRQAGGDKIEIFSIIPPEPLTIQTYRCDSAFFLEPLTTMLEPKEIYGLVTLDRREATIALLKGKRVEIVKNLGSMVPGKHKSGGQSAVRFERLAEIAAHEWFKKIGEICNKTFEDPKVKHVIVGGPGPTKQYFLNEGYLSNPVKNKIAGTVDTSYTDEFGITEMTQKAGEIDKELDITKEKDLVNKFIREASIGGKAAYGMAEVRQALEIGQVETLLLSEDLPWHRFEFECPQCGSKKTITAKEEPQTKCDKDGAQMKLLDVKDIVEDFVELAEKAGTGIEMISSETPEGEQFLKGFGGIGALLRFK